MRISWLIFGLAWLLALRVGYLDRLLQKHRSPDAPERAFRWTPQRVLRGELYTREGAKIRHQMGKTVLYVLTAFLTGVIVSMLGF
jgi:hypothetical protein